MNIFKENGAEIPIPLGVGMNATNKIWIIGNLKIEENTYFNIIWFLFVSKEYIENQGWKKGGSI